MRKNCVSSVRCWFCLTECECSVEFYSVPRCIERGNSKGNMLINTLLIGLFCWNKQLNYLLMCGNYLTVASVSIIGS